MYVIHKNYDIQFVGNLFIQKSARCPVAGQPELLILHFMPIFHEIDMLGQPNTFVHLTYQNTGNLMR